MSEHLDLDALAYLDEGLLDGTPQEPGARTHLASCTACQGELADLVAVRATLTSVPPERGIPFDVARRLDVALAAEAKARTEHAVVPLAVGADRVATVAARQTVVTRLPRRRLFPRLLAAAASVAAVGTIGYVATQTLDPSGGSGSGTEVAAGSSAGSAVDMYAATRQLARDGSLETPQPLSAAAESAPELPAQSAPDAPAESVPSGDLAEQPTDSGVAAPRSGALAAALPDDCGAQAGVDLERVVLAAAPFDYGDQPAVLIAFEGATPQTLTGVVLPTCDSPAADALFTSEVPR